MLEQLLTRPEEENEVPEHKATLFRKYICQFDTKNNITVTCNTGESELYKLRSQGENKQKTNW
jgi:hypothetical protein